MATVPWGPGTLIFGDPATGDHFEQEVTGASITHSYEELEVKPTLADVAKPAPRPIRAGDTLKFNMVNDLTPTGYYNYAMTNDLLVRTVAFVPNLTSAAAWNGSVTIKLPDEIGADEWGADIESAAELPFVDPVTFTPAAATP